MYTGITKLKGIYTTFDYEDFSNPPSEIILSYPAHDSWAANIRPNTFKLTDFLTISWKHAWHYNELPSAWISTNFFNEDGKDWIIEKFISATPKKVATIMNEYKEITIEEVLKKRVAFLDNIRKSLELENARIVTKLEMLEK